MILRFAHVAADKRLLDPRRSVTGAIVMTQAGCLNADNILTAAARLMTMTESCEDMSASGGFDGHLSAISMFLDCRSQHLQLPSNSTGSLIDDRMACE